MATEPKTVALVGAFDTKGNEYAFVRDRIIETGLSVLAIDTGVMGGRGSSSKPAFPVDVSSEAVAKAAGVSLTELREKKDRGAAMTAMAAGAAAVVASLYAQAKIDGIFGMGGTGGSSVVSAAMRALPIGFPKLLVTTAGGGDVSPYVGSKDIMILPSIVDVAGLNRILRPILVRAAGAICGMVRVSMTAAKVESDRPLLAASMFGNTTQCVDACREALTADGYEVLVFHATGAGGKTMESLVDDGFIAAVLDITTTEWADTVCGGVFDAGPDRLSAPGRVGIPHLIVPGCIDMCNFGPRETLPARYADRKLYVWNPSVTLMRTTPDENRTIGEAFAEKANRTRAPVGFLIPKRGYSLLDTEGQPFWDPQADQAFVAALRAKLDPKIPVEEMDAAINDPAFSARAVELMKSLIAQGSKSKTNQGAE